MGGAARFDPGSPPPPPADVSTQGDAARHSLFDRWKAIFHPKRKPAVFLRQPIAPSVVLACANCGFDYSVKRTEVGGKAALIWTCECGSEFMPPGGPESFNLVRR
jgi:hypothetical protein